MGDLDGRLWSVVGDFGEATLVSDFGGRYR